MPSPRSRLGSTVGDLRAALALLPDDMPVVVGWQSAQGFNALLCEDVTRALLMLLPRNVGLYDLAEALTPHDPLNQAGVR